MNKTIDSLMQSPTGTGRPPQELIDRGIQDGETFEDMGCPFLQKYIDELNEVYCGFMFRYYKDDIGEWEKAIKNVDELITKDIIDISDSSDFDDCVIIGRISNSYYFFWKHCSGRNDIGRCSIDSLGTPSKFVDLTKKWVTELMLEYDKRNPLRKIEEDYMKQIPRETFYNGNKLKKIII